MMGGFNIDYWRSSPNNKLLKNLEANTGVRQMIKQTTRYGNNNSTIDLIFTNSDYILEQGTLNVNINDHEAVYVGCSYINYDKNVFQGNVKSLNWPVWEINDVNECWELMEENISSVAENFRNIN